MTDEEQKELLVELRGSPSRYEKMAADEIERLAAELANANRLLEIGRRRSLEKSGGLEIDHSEIERLAEVSHCD